MLHLQFFKAIISRNATSKHSINDRKIHVSAPGIKTQLSIPLVEQCGITRHVSMSSLINTVLSMAVLSKKQIFVLTRGQKWLENNISDNLNGCG